MVHGRVVGKRLLDAAPSRLVMLDDLDLRILQVRDPQARVVVRVGLSLPTRATTLTRGIPLTGAALAARLGAATSRLVMPGILHGSTRI